ncbi:MAG: hypothetical protein J6Z43_02575 [Clostridiales bacterium]|nr:hypothetical protein [Clostridiales bacterium]
MDRFYEDNKRILKCYVVMALLFSIIMCFSAMSFASDGDVLPRYGGTFGTTFEQAAEFAFGTSISPSYVMGLSSALSILKEVGVDFLPKLSFGLCDLWVVRILSFIWVALTMLTPVIGEEMEKINTKYVGPFMIFAFEFIAIMETGAGGAKVHAAEFATDAVSAVAASAGNTVLLIIGEFFKIIFMLAAYFFVRYFNYAISALVALSTGLSAFMSGAFRVVRAIFVTVVLIIAEEYPWVFYIFYAMLLILSIFVFRWAYRIVNYFKAIYIAPVKRMIFRRKEIIPLVSKKAPKKLADSPISIPVYTLNTRVGVLDVKSRSKFWLACDSEGAFFYRRRFLNRPEIRIRLEDMYLREAGLFKRGFIEISDKDRRVARLVMSREYKPLFDDILNITEFGDYRIIEQKAKEDKKNERQRRREEILSLMKRKEGVTI